MKLMQSMFGKLPGVKTGWSRTHTKGKVGDDFGKTDKAKFGGPQISACMRSMAEWKETLAVEQESYTPFQAPDKGWQSTHILEMHCSGFKSQGLHFSTL